MRLEDMLSRLDRVRSSGKGWMATCPAHADSVPSLSIREDNCRILLHCFAGCTLSQILDVLGVTTRDLFLDDHPPRAIVAEYDYLDGKGALLYQVVRYYPKNFRQRSPDGKGGWRWSVKGTQQVLYRLPEVLTAKSVIICEGEKDCDTARTLDLVATTNAAGSKSKWLDSYTGVLRGKQITIIADADHPGRKHAENVANCLFGRVDSLKVLEFPGAKDLTEYVERGGTKEYLVDLIQNSPLWKPGTQPPARGFRLTSLRDLLAEPEEKVSWLLEGKLPSGGISIVSAKPKVGKSTLARCLALAVAKGEPFLGCPTTQGAVIYLALEEKRSEVRAHFRDLGATGEEAIHIHCAAAPQDAMIELCRLTEELKPVLVVVDPLFKFLRIKDEKAYAEVCAAMEPLLTLARESGTHVMLVHHNGKAERADAMDAILGSTAIFGGVDSAVILKRSGQCRTIQSSQKYGMDWPETTLDFDPDSRALSLGAEKSQSDANRLGEQILDVLRGRKDAPTRVEIEEQVEGKTAHKRAALKKLCASKDVLVMGSGSRGDPFRYHMDKSTSSSACTSIEVGTREQESISASERPENTGVFLVPTYPSDSILVPMNERQQEPFEGGGEEEEL